MPAPELVFNFATGQNQFFVELAEALIAELSAQDVPARLAFDEYPEPRRGRVFVLLPPHEYVALSRFQPPPALLARCVGISAEQPTSGFFAANLELGRELGAVFDVNPRAVRAYDRAGVEAHHLPLGYSACWDRFASAGERDIDVLFMGRLTPRRARALAHYADSFESMRVHLQLSDPGRPNLSAATDFLAGEEKRLLLSRAKVLLTLHGEDEPYFEWLRIAEAICAGCLVLSEHSSDTAPLRSGEHFVAGGVDRLGLLCAWAVEATDDRARIRTAAYELLRSERQNAAAATELVRVATALDASGLPGSSLAGARAAFLKAARAGPPSFAFQPPASPFSRGEGRVLRALKSQALVSTNLRRRLDRLALAGTDTENLTEQLEESPAWSTAPSRALTVVVPLYNHTAEITAALDSAVRGERSSWELVVVDDGSTDGGAEVVRGWMRARPELPSRLVRHRVNRGLSHARNTGIEYAASDLLLMLDADNELRPNARGRLLDALERDPEASFAYGISEQFSTDGPVGLVSQFPWDPERLRAGNYIDALALIRRSALERVGCYSDDPRLALGWEDYDLWVRIAEAGGHGAFVPEIISRYRIGHSSMVSVTNISLTDAFAAIADHAPRLMSGLEIPH